VSNLARQQCHVLVCRTARVESARNVNVTTWSCEYDNRSVFRPQNGLPAGGQAEAELQRTELAQETKLPSQDVPLQLSAREAWAPIVA
jgi:hypothetical protein